MKINVLCKDLISLLLMLLLVACSDTDNTPVNTVLQPRPAKILQVDFGRVNTKRVYPGTLAANQQADLSFRVSGELVDLPARPGMRVKRGQLLARLDGADFENQLSVAQARYELASIQHDQAQALLRRKIGSQLQYDQAAAELKSAAAARDQARDNLKYTRLVAPFDGVVARVEVENHQTVQAKMPILRLQDNRLLEFHFGVPESLVARLKVERDPKQRADFCGWLHFPDKPNKGYPACYREHESVPDPITRNYAVVFDVEPVDEFLLLPGMAANIELDFSALFAESDHQALLVPVEAVFDYQGQPAVWRLDAQMIPHPVAVEVGRIDQARIEIKAGLEAGDRIIAAGVGEIRPGMRVKPMKRERGL